MSNTDTTDIALAKSEEAKTLSKDLLTDHPIKAIPPIPKNVELTSTCVLVHDCRAALLKYFDEHDGDLKYNPISRRLLDLVTDDDLDDQSKKELTQVFIHQPPPELVTESNARPLNAFMKPPMNDPAELIKHRYLCKCGGLLLVGQTGLGKSSLSMQLAIKWSLGQSCFGLEPARPIKSLIVQAENDDGDIAEMKEGVFNGLNLSTTDQETASQSIRVIMENQNTGMKLFEKTIIPALIAEKPDMLWIDPALSYIGGDMNSQEAVGKFLRNQLNPVLVKYDCGGVLIHHTNKPVTNPDSIAIDPAYLGAGSAEWANWARAILALRKTAVANLYELVAAKRGVRLKWKAADNESLSFNKHISHCKRPDTICWIEMLSAEAEEMKANNGKTAADVLKHVPQAGLIAKDELINLCRKNNIGRNLITDLLEDLVEGGELFEHFAKRVNARPKVLLSRSPDNREEMIMLDRYTRNSHGIYFEPAGIE